MFIFADVATKFRPLFLVYVHFLHTSPRNLTTKLCRFNVSISRFRGGRERGVVARCQHVSRHLATTPRSAAASPPPRHAVGKAGFRRPALLTGKSHFLKKVRFCAFFVKIYFGRTMLCF